MIEVAGIGAALFDILMCADGFPKEDTKMEGFSTKHQCGGPCATALAAVSKMGVQTEYMGTVGDDAYGNFILDRLNVCGVKTGHVRVIPDKVSFHSFVLLNMKNSSRTCIWNKGTVPEPEPEDIYLDALKNAKYLHLDGHHLETAVYASKKAHEFGVKVSLDAGGVYPGIEKLLPFVDILIPSEEFALQITGISDPERAAECLQKVYHPEILIITQGSRGGFIWEKQRKKQYPVFPVNAVDSNGAGDVFHGAFLAARVKNMDIEDAAEFASAASALKCTRPGGQEGIPEYEEVLQFIRDREKT